jgi:hypothetical protein
MDFSLDEEQVMFKSMFRDFAQEEIAPLAPETDENERVPDGLLKAANARILEGYGLAVDESSLTGESVPVEKDPALALPESTPVAERRNLVFAGTTVTRGRGLRLWWRPAWRANWGAWLNWPARSSRLAPPFSRRCGS